ncbi:hypothetical protein A33M_4235 [Rhodovulum sp. PH10]|uniref:hypothetical protein n=1 Tax=Rhodovulum sp. PH10 TaxID=1187851 RepID=UPI00027C29BF|nr:hypothetical protein [Rhodovulum sp. PH10]EJW13315.1 hypothetical protein A33M_4235 [Rhodovulum sp. PH10]
MAAADDANLYSVIVKFSDDGSLAQCAAVRHQGTLWLVPDWIDDPDAPLMRPERMVSTAGMPLDKGGRLGKREFDWVLRQEIPKAALTGPLPLPDGSPLTIVARPDLTFPRKS